MIHMNHSDAYSMATLLKMVYAGGDHYLTRQLAEECTEFAQAVFKLIRSDNLETPMERETVEDNLIEELADVILCTDCLIADITEIDPGTIEHIGRVIEEKKIRAVNRAKEKGV